MMMMSRPLKLMLTALLSLVVCDAFLIDQTTEPPTRKNRRRSSITAQNEFRLMTDGYGSSGVENEKGPSFSASSSSSSSSSSSLSRRSLLLTSAGIAATGSSIIWTGARRNQDPSTAIAITITGGLMVTELQESSSTSTTFYNLDQAMVILESSVDKRFLHAVVASDYQSFYTKRPSSTMDDSRTTTRGRRSASVVSQSDLVTAAAAAAATRDDYRLAEPIHQQLNTQLLQDRPIQVDQSLLVHSNLETAARMWGKDNVVSVWPLMPLTTNGSGGERAVHYAWPAEEGDFATAITSSSSSSLLSKDKNMIIVDGIDCGRMSLEDALQGNMEVLVQAEEFLLIPQSSMETALRQRLQGAFLI